MSNKKIGFYFEDQLPNISTPLLDDFSFFYVKNEKSFNNEIVNIPKLFLYIKNINNFSSSLCCAIDSAPLHTSSPRPNCSASERRWTN